MRKIYPVSKATTKWMSKIEEKDSKNANFIKQFPS